MLLGPDVPPWQMRWARRPGITPPDTFGSLSIATPMVAPVPPGASDMIRNTQPPQAQEPPQALATSTNENDGSVNHSAIAGIISSANARLTATFAAAKADELPKLDNAQPQQRNATTTASTSSSPAVFMTYESILQADDNTKDNSDTYDPEYLQLILNAADEDELAEIDAKYATPHNPQVDGFETAAEFEAAVREHTTLYDEEDDDLDTGQFETFAEFQAAVREHTSLYDEEDEVPHWSEHFDSYEDFMAAANDPNLGDGTD